MRVSAGGDVFPGDSVLFMSEGLTVAQASLTGEMIPVDKTTRLGPPPANYNFDIIHNDNICLAGTSVATGSGHAMIISTGDKTYVASIAKDLAKKRPLNAMQIGVRKVSYLLLTFMAVMSPIVFVIQGGLSHDWKSAIFFAISIAVGITPEMLPMIVVCSSFLVSLTKTGLMGKILLVGFQFGPLSCPSRTEKGDRQTFRRDSKPWSRQCPLLGQNGHSDDRPRSSVLLDHWFRR